MTTPALTIEELKKRACETIDKRKKEMASSDGQRARDARGRDTFSYYDDSNQNFYKVKYIYNYLSSFRLCE